MTRWILLLVGLALLAAAPWFASPVLLQFAINTLLLAVLAQGWNLIGGYAGYASFGNSAFYGLGVYGAAIAMAQYHTSFAVALLCSAVLGAAGALIFGAPILRLRGPYFAIATLGLAAVMAAVASNLPIAGENIGLILPLIRGDDMFYELALALLVATTASVWLIARSRFGAALVALREDEDAAVVMGIDTTFYKVAALTVAATFSALAGGVHAYWITFVDPASAFDPRLNLEMVIMAVFGGPGTVAGPLIGAFVLSAVSELLANTVSTVASLFFGAVVVLAVIFMPKGLIALAAGLRRDGFRHILFEMRKYRL